jgi:hypothetical protein
MMLGASKRAVLLGGLSLVIAAGCAIDSPPACTFGGSITGSWNGYSFGSLEIAHYQPAGGPSPHDESRPPGTPESFDVSDAGGMISGLSLSYRGATPSWQIIANCPGPGACPQAGSTTGNLSATRISDTCYDVTFHVEFSSTDVLDGNVRVSE